MSFESLLNTLLPPDFFSHPSVQRLQRLLQQHIGDAPITHVPLGLFPELAGRLDSLAIKRDDLLHPEISGNKWRKLKYNLLMAAYLGHDTLYSFGGAYSNHIAALAAAGALFGFKTVGFIRGEAYESLNPTLQRATEHGMALHYLTRQQYRQRSDTVFLQQLAEDFPSGYWIPEGGSNALAWLGCAELAGEIPEGYDAWCVPCGTAGTLAGLLLGCRMPVAIWGVAVHTDVQGLIQAVQRCLAEQGVSMAAYHMAGDYHFGGYAKFSTVLQQFCQSFTAKTQIPIEPVYSGKMLYGIFDLLQRRQSPIKGRHLLLVHTGGLQGLEGLRQRGLWV